MKSVDTDRLILVNRDKFMEVVDKDNLACRDSEIVDDQYHADWFYEYEGISYFEVPVIQIHSGSITFINGRHRTIVLSRFLGSFPVAVGNIDCDHVFGSRTRTRTSLDTYDSICAVELEEHASIGLPNLPLGDFKKA
jgi:hypothetical protein